MVTAFAILAMFPECLPNHLSPAPSLVRRFVCPSLSDFHCVDVSGPLQSVDHRISYIWKQWRLDRQLSDFDFQSVFSAKWIFAMQILWQLSAAWETQTPPATTPPTKQPAWMVLPGQNAWVLISIQFSSNPCVRGVRSMALVSQTLTPFADLADVTLADENTSSIENHDANRTIPNTMAVQVAQNTNGAKFPTIASGTTSSQNI